jgi:RND superfamily putative drug exporter
VFFGGGLGGWCARNRWPVVAAWLTAVVLSLVGLPRLLSTVGAPSPAIDGAPAGRASQIIARELPQLGQEQLVLIVRSERRTNDDPVFRAATAAAAEALGRDPGVRGVFPLPRAGSTGDRGVFAGLAGVYHDPHNVYALVGVAGDGSTRQLAIPRQRAAIQSAASTVDNEIKAYLLGESPVNYDLRRIELVDLARAELVAVPLALLILLLGLGTLGAALAPLVLAGVSVPVTLGLFGLIAPAAGFDVVLLTIVSMVGVAVGIDYALLVVSRFIEERGRGTPPERAATTAVATAGRTAVYSGVVVVLASGSLLFVRSQVFREFAFGTAVVIGVALAAVHTLLPALLVAGSRWLRGRRDPGAGRWARWARHLMRHPWRYSLITMAILLAAAAPALSLRTGVDFGRGALAGTPSGPALRIVERDGFAGAAGTVGVVLPRRPGTAPPDTGALAAALRAHPGVAGVVDVDNGRTLRLLVVVPTTAPDTGRSAGLAREIRDDLVPRTLPGRPEVLVGGPGGLLLDVTEETAGKLWWVIGFVLALSLLLLALMFRSLLLPIKAVLLNLLATMVALGLTVLAFQHGLAAHVFGFTSLGTIQVHLPLVIFAVLFGLSMDYEVFLVRRIQEEYRRTGDNTEAVAIGLQRTARLISVAAAIMVAVFASVVFSRALELQQLGFALAVAVTVDATLIRLVLVPSLMRLLGRWNWWPGLRRAPVAGPASLHGAPEMPERVNSAPTRKTPQTSEAGPGWIDTVRRAGRR